ncbi:MAG: rhomboid family intramembrane serine protease [Candidatus Pacebacteria bacterium]|nr:rhomboid family intramembrane serine protease [Candidatus Paceibacterota bacterium]
MKLCGRLAKKINPLIPDNLTIYLLTGQLIAFALSLSNPELPALFPLQGSLVLKGEWWRLLTVLFMPVVSGPLLAVLTWYIYYVFGTALERQWGKFRYFLYLFSMYLGIVISSFIFPQVVLNNSFIFSSLFLAFAYLYPDFLLYIFFFIPLKVKWLALLLWLRTVIAFIFGSTASRLPALLSSGIFFLFFGREILFSAKNLGRRSLKKSRQISRAGESYLKCAICKATEKDKKVFYYCNTCQPPTCYCEDHINNHKHKLTLN